MNEDKYNTFWKIIKDNKIEIPTIQRDYAYGRKSAKTIRTKLIGDIIKSIQDNEPINLDFVYGKLLGKENQISFERNKSNIQSLLKSIKSYATDLNVEISYDVTKQDYKSQNKITFIPLDGQQRLTTLYLIHWYIIQLNRDHESLEILKSFSYSTRISSKDFCKMLCENQFELVPSTKTASDVICNHEKYFSFWDKDPTVKSMLVVIDEIHKVLTNDSNDYAAYWKAITTTDLISFDFFDLDDFELTDDLYIKMNARGKHLSNFEKFKAWLIKEYKESITVKDWKKNLDIKWNDIFWKAKEKSNHSIDTEYLQFFKILYLGDYMKSQGIDSFGMNEEGDLKYYNTDELILDDFKSVVSVLRKKDANPIEIFKKEKLFIHKINDYLHLLDFSRFDIDNNTELLINKYISTEFSNLFFGEKLNNLTWWDTTFHYAISRYLLKVENNNQYFSQWVRVISNLIYNTRIDTPKLFIEAIKAIDSLLTKIIVSDSVYKIVGNMQEDDITFFSANQKEEEILKSSLIIVDPKWEQVFIAAENHNYFYGQIGFILDMSEDPKVMASFKDKYGKVAALFSEEVLNDETYILTRALLTQGDCFYHEGDNRIFNFNFRGTLRHRTENWRKFFESKVDFIIKLIEHPKFDETKILDSLNEIIEFEKPKLNGSYEAKFVMNSKLLAYAKKNYIRRYNKGYYLLNSTRLSGYYTELYTYDWFLEHSEKYKAANPDIKIEYSAVKGEDNEPNIQIAKNNHESKIKLDSKTGEFILTTAVSSKNFNTLNDAINSAINYCYDQPN